MGVQPPNFSWVLPSRLAGLALPRLPAHYQFLLDQGVRHLVSLTERGPPHSDSCPGLTLHRLRIPDFCPPGPEQIDRFVKIVDEANARGEWSICPIQRSQTDQMAYSPVNKGHALCQGVAVPRTPKTAPATETCRILRRVEAATNARPPWVPGLSWQALASWKPRE
ncbi:dual specificity protein phosphatase 23 isoform 1-T1 [Dama dama]|uniref:dual specificity protein phosphatase 23 isoform X1 n=1 Tax=Dama dama TaxID=30532 RepID=UPI002A370A76|nr:dual specificity protein phosphatase 23 isoform X1 [Dama dama]